ncbi:MAG: TPM domain-containing protein [Lachnospiraceae bacterium]|nr:TPM domain-containing protein [Lachnospiraceae bacterium]
MDKDIFKLALKQYVHYFRGWFIITAIFMAVTLIVAVPKYRASKQVVERNNTQVTTAERVFDYADVLTEEQEQKLREYIAECEERGQTDLIVVTIDQPMGTSDYAWENNMMNYADDFYDNRAYGYNKAFGDGALLLDNWYEDENGSQKGSWLSTSGKMEEYIGAYEEGVVLDAMDKYIDIDPYRAYYAAVTKLADYGENGYESDYTREGMSSTLFCFAGVIPIIVALIYALSNLKKTPAKDTTVPNTYVMNGRAVVNNKQDQFLRKSVATRHIDTSSSGGSSRSGGHSGGGSHGHHTSSGGHSHGGGGRRR